MNRFDRFTERARMALTLAQEEATRCNHSDVGTEHLLLGPFWINGFRERRRAW